MGRSFGASFAALAPQKVIPGVFWTLKLTFPEPWGEQYFSDRSVTVGGNAHEALVTGWGDIASFVDREEKRWDVSLVTIEFTNFPVMSTGERLSDLFTEDLETVAADVYLNLKDDDGTIQQELMFRGLVQAPISYDYERASLTVMALSEAHLNKSVLRVVTREDFPAMREADIGATISIAVGTVERSPGRVVKASAKTSPVADPNNTSSAKLLDFQASADAVSQGWEITVLSSPTDASQNGTDSFAHVGEVDAAPSFDAVSSADTGATADPTLTWPHTCSGSKRVLLVAVANRHPGGTGRIPKSVTYDGVAMRREVQAFSGAVSVSIWALLDPATGANNVVVTNFDGESQHIVGSAVSFTDAQMSNFSTLNLPGNPPNSLSYLDKGTRNLPTSVSAALQGGRFGRFYALVDAIARSGEQAITKSESTQTQRTNRATSAGAGGARGAVATTVVTNAPRITQATGWTWSGSASAAYAAMYLPGLEKVYAQSFARSGAVSGVKVRLRRFDRWAQGGNAFAFVQVRPDDGGKPHATTVLAQSTQLTLTSDTPAVFTVGFATPVTTGATLWIVVLSVNNVHSGDPQTLWAKNSAGGYADGRAIEGVMRDKLNGARTIEWDTGVLATEDFWFEVLWAGQTGYEFFGSVTGFDGTGSVESDSVSDSGQITLLASHWQGSPAAGDIFRFSVDNSENKVIFSESPSDTPVSEIGTVFWDDVPVADPSASSSIGAALTDFGEGTNSAVATKLTVDVGGLYKSIEVALAKVGAPDQAVSLQVREAIGSIPSGVVLGSVEIAPAGITSTAAFVSGVFDEPVALEAGTYFLVASTGQSDAANHYKAYRATSVSGGLADVGAKEAAGAWSVLASTGHAAKLTAATLNKQASIDDGTGENVASVGFDVPIPDFAEITANLLGIEDDLSGTYTGTASAFIRRPDALIHWLALRAGVSTAEIDLAGTFADSGSSYGGLYLFDGLIQDSETYKRLFLRLAFECRSAVDWPVDTLQLKFLPLRVTTADRTIAYADLVAERNRPMLVVARTDTTKLVNFVDVRFQRVARSIRELTAYARVMNARNTDSIERFGQREDPALFFMDFLRKEDAATDAAEYYANRLSNPRQIVEATLKYPFLDVEKDDSAAFSLVKVVGV